MTPTPEKNVFFVDGSGRVIKAPRHLKPKDGWRIATEADLKAAADKAEANEKSAKEAERAKAAADLATLHAAMAAAVAHSSPTPAKKGG